VPGTLHFFLPAVLRPRPVPASSAPTTSNLFSTVSQHERTGNAMKKQIRQWIVVTMVGFSSFIGPLHAENFEPVFGSEDETQRPLPPDALSAVRAHAKTTEYRDCAAGKFVGSAVDLTGHGQSNDWIAKTADGCAWGAASVAIWVLKRESNGYRVVLFSGGQVVSLNRARAGEVRDLQIVSRTAGHYSQATYKFDGRIYGEAKSRSVDFSDPADCKRNRDVCDVH
jgi:hypothetical protein